MKGVIHVYFVTEQGTISIEYYSKKPYEISIKTPASVGFLQDNARPYVDTHIIATIHKLKPTIHLHPQANSGPRLL